MKWTRDEEMWSREGRKNPTCDTPHPNPVSKVGLNQLSTQEGTMVVISFYMFTNGRKEEMVSLYLNGSYQPRMSVFS